MRRTKIDSSLERQILVAMVTSTPFLGSVAQQVEAELFASQVSQRVAAWCQEHFVGYGEAPGRAIEARYHAWLEHDKPEEDEAGAVGDFLGSLSDQYDAAGAINVPYMLDAAGKYLTLRRVKRLRESLEGSELAGNSEEAVQSIQGFRTVAGGDRLGYDPTRDREAIRRAFAESHEPVIEFSGAAGDFFNRALTRDSLIGVQGPEKTAKTWWCLEFAIRALRCRRRVAFFEVGDLSEAQLTTRMAVRMAGRPLWEQHCREVLVPSSLETEEVTNDDGTVARQARISYEKRSFRAPLNESMALRAQRVFRRRMRVPKGEHWLMFSIHPNSSINVAGIHGILERWRYELEFVPDVVVIDYADILAPEDSRKEHRHQINDTWKALRKLSQEWHVCAIVPTQANAAAYTTRTQTRANVSEDKRKFAHVTGMLGLNQTEEEREQQIMRLNWLALRESEYSQRRCLWVAQCLPLAQAMTRACW